MPPVFRERIVAQETADQQTQETADQGTQQNPMQMPMVQQIPMQMQQIHCRFVELPHLRV
jgi:hypothetical protein